MENSFFNNKQAIAYKVLITSFDDDYYYGTFYRAYEGGFKQHIGNIYLDFDDQDDDFPHSYVYFSCPVIIHDRQLFVDFELDEVEQDSSELEDSISSVVILSAKLIYKALKTEGKTVELVIR